MGQSSQTNETKPACCHRCDQLEDIVLKLLDALDRKGTEQDGNWGRPSFHDEVKELKLRLLDGTHT
jgi:hypothetical protein